MHSGKKRSCETQLITVINDWAKILDNDGQVYTSILEKDFDTPSPPPPLMNYINVSNIVTVLVGRI